MIWALEVRNLVNKEFYYQIKAESVTLVDLYRDID